MNIRLETPLIPKSLNNLLRMHWAARRRHERTWLGHIGVAKAQAGVFKAPELERVEIHIQIMHTGRGILDEDNVWGGLKPMFDALVKVGILVDDNDQVIIRRTLTRTRVKHLAEAKTIIKIVDKA